MKQANYFSSMVVLFNCLLKVSYHFVDTMGLMAILYTLILQLCIRYFYHIFPLWKQEGISEPSYFILFPGMNLTTCQRLLVLFVEKPHQIPRSDSCEHTWTTMMLMFLLLHSDPTGQRDTAANSRFSKGELGESCSYVSDSQNPTVPFHWEHTAIV